MFDCSLMGLELPMRSDEETEAVRMPAAAEAARGVCRPPASATDEGVPGQRLSPGHERMQPAWAG